MLLNNLKVTTLIFYFITYTTFSQTTGTIGSSIDDEISSVVQADNNLNTYTCGSLNQDACVIKRNVSNQIIWSKTIDVSTTMDSEILNLRVIGDTIIGCGMITSGSTVNGGFFFKMNAVTGGVYWIKKNETAKQYFSGITYSHNRIYLTGSRVNGGNDYHARVWSVNSTNGNTIWQTPLLDFTFPGFNIDYIDDVMNSTDMINGKMFITGRSYVNGATSLDMRATLIGIDSLGNIFLQKFLLFNTTGSTVNRFYPEDISYDGDSLVIAMFGDDNCSSCSDFKTGIIKTDLFGNVSWARYYDIQTVTNEYVKGINVTNDGYVLYGHVNHGLSSQKGFAIKLNKSGVFQFGRTITPPSGGTLSCISGVIFVGGKSVYKNNTHYLPFTFTSSTSNKDILIVAMNNNLNDPLSCYNITPVSVLTSSFIPYSGTINVLQQASTVNTTSATTATPVNIVVPCSNVSTTINHNSNCVSDTITISVTGINTPIISWSNGTSGFSTISSNTNPIIVTVYDQINCCTIYDTVTPIFSATGGGNTIMNLPADTNICLNQGSSYIISPIIQNPNSNFQYLWSTNSTTSNLSVSSSGQYWLQMTNSCQTLRDTINITVDYFPELDNDTIFSLCDNNFPIQLNPTVNNVNMYSWNDGDTSLNKTIINSGIYTFTATNICGSASQTFEIFTLNNPSILLSASIDTCIQAQGTILLQSQSSDVTSFLWSTGDTTSSVYVGNTQTYYVIGSNNCNSDTAQIDVIINFIPEIYLPANLDTCFETGIGFPLTANGNNGQYSWSNGTVGNSTWVLDEGTYTCYLTNLCGTDSSVIQINQVAGIDLYLPSDSLYFCSPNISIDELEIQSNSSFLIYGSSPSPILHIYESGTYSIIASNQCGSQEDSIYIYISGIESNIYMPNSFTPNADFINEKLNIHTVDITITHVEIYDRWGLKVFEEDGGFSGWDGRYNGKICTDGIYTIKILYYDCLNLNNEFVGHINLLK